MSLAAVSQICVIHEAMNGSKNLKIHKKDCFKNVDISMQNDVLAVKNSVDPDQK